MQIPARRIRCCGCNIQIHTDYRIPVEKKGAAWPLSKLERPLLGQAFIVFLGTLHRGWSSFTMHRFTTGEHCRPFKDDKGQNTANYFKDKDVTAQAGSCSHSILGWLSTDFRKMKILSKYLNCCLNSGWGSFSKSKSHSSQGTVPAWFPTWEPIHGCGSCPPTSLPTGFSKWGLSHISRAWNGSPHSS